jgi:cytochrome P450
LYHIAQSERYFKNALEFTPKRWIDNKDEIHKFSALPFGHGPRMCIGRRLAEQNIYLIVMKILQNYKIEYLGEKSTNLKFSILYF